MAYTVSGIKLFSRNSNPNVFCMLNSRSSHLLGISDNKIKLIDFNKPNPDENTNEICYENQKIQDLRFISGPGNSKVCIKHQANDSTKEYQVYILDLLRYEKTLNVTKE